jgi:hypothetical protein
MKAILTLASSLILLASCSNSMIAKSSDYSVNKEVSSADEHTVAAKGPNASAVTEPVRILSSQKLSLREIPTTVLAGINKAYPYKNIISITQLSTESESYYQLVLQERKKKNITVVFDSNAKETTLP